MEWIAREHLRFCWHSFYVKTGYLPFRITVLARDSIFYFIVVGGPSLLALCNHACWLRIYYVVALLAFNVGDEGVNTVHIYSSLCVYQTSASLNVSWHSHFSLAECITPIAVGPVFVRCEIFSTPPHQVGRMTMNIRGLIMDDPEHTIHLRTLQFNMQLEAESDAEIEG